MVRKPTLPVAEKVSLTNRKKHRKLQAVAGKATMFLTEKKDNIKQSKINKHEPPLDEILYDQISVGENMDKQSRASTRKTRPKILYIF